MSEARDVAFDLHAASVRLLRALRRVDVEMGLGAARASALSVIVFAGPVGASKLAEIEQVRGPTMTRIVDRLVRDGLATRTRGPEDRRQVMVAATAKGRRLMEQGRERRVAVLAEAMRDLGPGELGTLAKAAALLDEMAF